MVKMRCSVDNFTDAFQESLVSIKCKVSSGGGMCMCLWRWWRCDVVRLGKMLLLLNWRLGLGLKMLWLLLLLEMMLGRRVHMGLMMWRWCVCIAGVGNWSGVTGTNGRCKISKAR